MPHFNTIFVFYCFRVFVKLNNMFPVFAVRSDQSYNSLLERKHSTSHHYCSEKYIITEETIAHLTLLVITDQQLGC